ncbi:MAG TPA: hypothetical protein P5077_02925 [bacterium]|nr:hypothetical protein [bacterium]
MRKKTIIIYIAWAAVSAVGVFLYALFEADILGYEVIYYQILSLLFVVVYVIVFFLIDMLCHDYKVFFINIKKNSLEDWFYSAMKHAVILALVIATVLYVARGWMFLFNNITSSTYKQTISINIDKTKIKTGIFRKYNFKNIKKPIYMDGYLGEYNIPYYPYEAYLFIEKNDIGYFNENELCLKAERGMMGIIYTSKWGRWEYDENKKKRYKKKTVSYIFDREDYFITNASEGECNQ